MITNNINENPKQISLLQKKKFKDDRQSTAEFKKRQKKKKTIQPTSLILSNEFEELKTIDEITDNTTIKTQEIDEEIETKLKLIKNKELNLNDNININNEEEKETEIKENKNQEKISDYTLFLKNLPSKTDVANNINQNELNNIPKINSENGTQSIVSISLANEKYVVKTKAKLEEELNLKDQLLENSSQNLIEIMDEPPTRKGVCIALELFKKRGLLKPEEGIGRYNDKSYTTNDYAYGLLEDSKKKNEIVIEYRDEQGRLLKPKESARFQSHIFHGEGPGIKKKEKLLVREQKKQKAESTFFSNNTKTLKYMNYEQKNKNKAFAVLESSNYSSFL